MELKMRDLRGDDLFILLNIFSKLDMKDDIIALFDESTKLMTPAEVNAIMKKHSGNAPEQEKALKAEFEARATARGMSVMAKLSLKALSNIVNIRDDLNGLFAELCGVKVNQIKELGLKDYTALVVAFFKKPELKDFFVSISSLMGSVTTASTE